MINPILLLFLILSTTAMADETLGKICFGKNLAKPQSEHTDRLYLKINDSKILFFIRPYEGAVLKELNTSKDYKVQVYFDDQLVQSWILNFSKLNTQTVVIWRSTGS